MLSIENAPHGKKVLCCTRRVGIVGKPKCGELGDAVAVEEFERFLAVLDGFSSESLPALRVDDDDDETQGWKKVIRVLLDSSAAANNQTLLPPGPTSLPPFLFLDISVPHIIAYMEGGRCWTCGGLRWICPGCGGIGRAFGVHMGCLVDLACPLCQGLNFSMDDRAYHNEDHWVDPSEDVRKERQDRIEGRLAELGYPKAKWLWNLNCFHMT